MEKKNLNASRHESGVEQIAPRRGGLKIEMLPPAAGVVANIGLVRRVFQSEQLKGGAINMTIETLTVEDRVENYVQLFETIRGRVGDDHLAIAILEQCGKDFRVAQMRGVDRGDRLDSQSSGELPATPKQLAFLEKLQVRYIPQNLTKDRASRMIDEAQARSLAT